jgi:hypothetical protein
MALDRPARRRDAGRMTPILPPTWLAAAFQPPLVACLAALVIGALLTLAGQRRLAGIGAAAGLALALFLVFGLRMVTPRMLPERLPWLVLAAGAAGLVGDLLRLRGALAGLLAAAAALLGGWFMLGAPRHLPDLGRIAAEAAPVLAAFAVPLWRLVPARATAEGAGAAVSAAALLAVGLWLAGSAAVFVGLAASVAGAALGVLLVAFAAPGAGIGFTGALALGTGLGGVAAAAGLALRLPPVWVACLAPLAGLAAGRWVAARLGLAGEGGLAAALSVLVAGLPLVGLAWGLRHLL